MPNTSNPAVTRPREVVGIFPGYASLESAIDDLELAGFARCELSLVASQEVAQSVGSIVKLTDDPLARVI